MRSILKINKINYARNRKVDGFDFFYSLLRGVMEVSVAGSLKGGTGCHPELHLPYGTEKSESNEFQAGYFKPQG